MQRTDIIEAQYMTSSQLLALRNKIFIERVTLEAAVLGLYPNFNVNDTQNMQDLRTSLLTTYPQIASVLEVAEINNRVTRRVTQTTNLRNQFRINNELVSFNFNWARVPTGGEAYQTFRSNAIALLDRELETARLLSKSNKIDKLS
jgi:hypothetical protein